MKTSQWVRFASLAVSGIVIITFDLLGGHSSGAGTTAFVLAVCLDFWCDIDANKKEERIDELQREVRLLASIIDRDKGLPPTETGIFEK